MDYLHARQILELSKNYSEEELKGNYRVLVKKFHPDNPVSGNEKKFLDVQEAYQYLLNNQNHEKDNNRTNDNEKSTMVVCPVCNGNGWRREKIKTSRGFMAQKVACTACKGTGKRKG